MRSLTVLLPNLSIKNRLLLRRLSRLIITRLFLSPFAWLVLFTIVGFGSTVINAAQESKAIKIITESAQTLLLRQTGTEGYSIIFIPAPLVNPKEADAIEFAAENIRVVARDLQHKMYLRIAEMAVILIGIWCAFILFHKIFVFEINQSPNRQRQ